ncbi:hypothetical protein ElyMa_003201200 [Elysia marginata]|uniref:Uncharacterized protein n=1 Tax=Elysia marginata TaxID=1093978 RepID=A0AAV4J4R2_9GAST|nr:hypothetical protein ElyMa_003201200 [Elysia marginata]
MRSDQWLSVSLLLALCSNASLLLILTFNVLHNSSDSDEQAQYEPAASALQHPVHESRTLRFCEKLLAQFTSGPSQYIDKNTPGNVNVFSQRVKTERFLKQESSDPNRVQDSQIWQTEIIGTPSAYIQNKDNDLKRKIGLFLQLYKQLSDIDPKHYRPRSRTGQNRVLKKAHGSSETQTTISSEADDISSPFSIKQSNAKSTSANGHSKSEILRSEQDSLNKNRKKRDTALLEQKTGPLLEQKAGPDGDYLSYEFQFSKLKENKTYQFSSPVSDILIPGLVAFEDNMIR